MIGLGQHWLHCILTVEKTIISFTKEHLSRRLGNWLKQRPGQALSTRKIWNLQDLSVTYPDHLQGLRDWNLQKVNETFTEKKTKWKKILNFNLFHSRILCQNCCDLLYAIATGDTVETPNLNLQTRAAGTTEMCKGQARKAQLFTWKAVGETYPRRSAVCFCLVDLFFFGGEAILRSFLVENQWFTVWFFLLEFSLGRKKGSSTSRFLVQIKNSNENAFLVSNNFEISEEPTICVLTTPWWMRLLQFSMTQLDS